METEPRFYIALVVVEGQFFRCYIRDGGKGLRRLGPRDGTIVRADGLDTHGISGLDGGLELVGGLPVLAQAGIFRRYGYQLSIYVTGNGNVFGGFTIIVETIGGIDGMLLVRREQTGLQDQLLLRAGGIKEYRRFAGNGQAEDR